MADCNDLFTEFLSTITISSTQRENLQTGKDAIRERMCAYFADELGVQQPSFFLQGSYSLKTMVRPLGSGEYDLDDGVYLEHTDDDMLTPTPQTVSGWIMQAVDGHVAKEPQNLKNCVRLVYAAGYHIDLPIYRYIDGKIYLGTLEGNKWITSDAKAFNEWFRDRLEVTEQMRSCIKYLKAWRDFLDSDLKGIHITVLTGLNHVPVEDRDDESVARTVAKIIQYLEERRAIWNPVDDAENLISEWTDSKISATIRHLKSFSDRAKIALSAADADDAAREWQSLFGDRFPAKSNKDKETVGIAAAIPLVVITHNPKPYCEAALY